MTHSIGAHQSLWRIAHFKTEEELVFIKARIELRHRAFHDKDLCFFCNESLVKDAPRGYVIRIGHTEAQCLLSHFC